MPRKGENIYKRKDGRWEGRYIKGRCGNKANYGYIYGKSYSEVKKKLFQKRIEQECEKSKYVLDKPENPIFENVAALWLKETKPGVKESTWIKYHNMLNSYINPHLGNIKISMIDYELVSGLCIELLTVGGVEKKGLSSKTVSDVLSIIKSVLKYASRRKYQIDQSVMDVSIKLKSAQLRIFSKQETAHLIEKITKLHDSTSIGILICLFTGIRIGELCALTWGDISLETNIMHIHKTMQRIQTPEEKNKTKIIISEPKSQCSIRDIPLPQALMEYLSLPGPADAFLLTGTSRKYIEPRTMQNRFKKILSECGIENANFHSLRHTFATRCVEGGFDIKSLSEILGHANVNITLNRYVHPSMDLKKKSMEMVSDIFAVK